MKHYRLIFLALLAAALMACQPAATNTPEARAPIATRAPVRVSGERATVDAQNQAVQATNEAIIHCRRSRLNRLPPLKRRPTTG